MAYLGDIRENSISPEGVIWENDNRKDARYYWNGAFIDLCDLPGEDYAKTIFVTSGSGNEPSSPSKTQNPITVQEVKYTDENGNEFYAYKAVSKQPVTSDVVVEITVQDENGVEEKIVMTVSNGSASSEIQPTKILMKSSRPTVITSDHNPKEDDKFEYNTVLPEDKPTFPMAYSLTMLSGRVDMISDEELIQKIMENGKIAMKNETTSEKFLVDFTPIAVDGLSNMNAVEMTNALINNAQDIIIVTDKEIKSIEQADVSGINEKSLWVTREHGVVIDGKTYFVLYKRDEGQTSQSRVYDPLTNEVIGAESREYIIYYE